MRFKFILSFFLMTLLSAGAAFSQDTGKASSGKAQGGGYLAAKTQNPVGAMYSLPFKFNFDYGADNGEATFLNIQPVIPVTVGDWNLINRVIVPIIVTPGLVTGTPGIPNPVQGDQKIEDTGPMTRKRMETADDEFADAAIDFIDRAHKADKPFFTWVLRYRH